MSYLLRYRLSLAKILLAETGRHVTAIAHEVGFSDHAYFSRAFRREVGVSPTAFRAQSGDAALSS
jgi:two-component system response regulator YesN